MDLPDVDNTEEFRCISLCTGYAGLELGIKRVIPNLRTVCYVEVEAFACCNLVAKIEAGKLDAAPVWTDIKTFDPEPFRGRIHIITAGYPCQPFSTAGKRKGTADPRHLWPYIERIIETVEPVWFFGENVSGHLTIGYPAVYRSLHNLGYKVEAGLFTAAECGAPHRRERLFILAYNETSRFTRSYLSIRQSQRQKQTSANALWISQMADTESQRFASSKQSRNKKARLADQNYYGMWPSRPGQPQYEWEKPRVVGVVGDTRCGSKRKSKEHKIATINETRSQRKSSTDLSGLSVKSEQLQVKSRLGRAANGTSSRVDRLRLLGNGVVPQQVELAFRYLMSLNDFEANR